MGKTHITAKLHRTDLVMCTHFREGKTLSYSGINTVFDQSRSMTTAVYIKQINLIFFRWPQHNKKCQKTIKHDLWELDFNKGKSTIFIRL